MRASPRAPQPARTEATAAEFACDSRYPAFRSPLPSPHRDSEYVFHTMMIFIQASQRDLYRIDRLLFKGGLSSAAISTLCCQHAFVLAYDPEPAGLIKLKPRPMRTRKEVSECTCVLAGEGGAYAPEQVRSHRWMDYLPTSLPSLPTYLHTYLPLSYAPRLHTRTYSCAYTQGSGFRALVPHPHPDRVIYRVSGRIPRHLHRSSPPGASSRARERD